MPLEQLVHDGEVLGAFPLLNFSSECECGESANAICVALEARRFDHRNILLRVVHEEIAAVSRLG
jgi:hypothetical protein